MTEEIKLICSRNVCLVIKAEDDRIIDKIVADLVKSITPFRRATGHLKLVAAWKFIAALDTKDLSSRHMARKVDIPSDPW